MDFGADMSAVSLTDQDPRRCAVLAIHWQNDVISADGAFGRHFAAMASGRGILSRTRTALVAARRLGMVVVHVKVVFEADLSDVIVNSPLFSHVVSTGGFARGSSGVEFIEQLAPAPGDFVVEHNRISAFYGTNLPVVLQKHDVDTVILTGIATNVAVESTARHAADIGLKVVVLSDCCTASEEAEHEASLRTMRLFTTEVTESGPFFATFPGAR
jgi:nicotinamidase-related amidase